jgi:transposase
MPKNPSRHNREAHALMGFVGIDVAKASVTIFDGNTRRCWSVANTPAALHGALAPLAGRVLAVCEATGGFERAVLDVAIALGLAIHRADAAKTKAFIASHGGNAKTDAEDARWLAQYAAERNARLGRWSPPDPRREELAQLVRARLDLIDERQRVRNRLAAPGAGAAVQAIMARHQATLDALVAELDEAIAQLIATNDSLKHAEAALCAQKGTGKIVARTLLALLPELGTLGPKQAASLAGLAPHARESGAWKGKQRMHGGRAGLRQILFMAALSAAHRHPVLSGFYHRLLAAGKPKRLALAAVARKIIVIANAVLRDLQSPAVQPA